MGMSATVYLLSAHAYYAGVAGDMTAFQPDENAVELDKAWHSIHVLVTGDATLRFLTTGVPLPGADETCELHSPDAITALSQRIGEATPSDLMKAFDTDTFNAQRIYPAPWDETGADYVAPYLHVFLETLRQAALTRHGLFVVIA
jgi:Domain of unknown function (DUF1877)